MNDAKYFLDTNVFVYASDPLADEKRPIAEALIERALQDGLGVVSFQVVQEFCSVVTRKFASTFLPQHLREYIAKVFARLCQVQSSIHLYQSCLDIAQLTGYSFYDSLILAAASNAGCKTLFTEDLQVGRTVAGVEIVNPFCPSG
jgi:predicted nucleic acid-binding protein